MFHVCSNSPQISFSAVRIHTEWKWIACCTSAWSVLWPLHWKHNSAGAAKHPLNIHSPHPLKLNGMGSLHVCCLLIGLFILICVSANHSTDFHTSVSILCFHVAWSYSVVPHGNQPCLSSLRKGQQNVMLLSLHVNLTKIQSWISRHIWSPTFIDVSC